MSEPPEEELIRRLTALKDRGSFSVPKTGPPDDVIIVSVDKMRAYFRPDSTSVYYAGKIVYRRGPRPAINDFTHPADIDLCVSVLRAAMVLDDLADAGKPDGDAG